MKRTRVTNAFINYLHRTGANYNHIINDLVRYCGFNISRVDYVNDGRPFGRIVAKGYNGEEHNLYL